ncbi:MAG: S16 family serine protease [Candidatus Aenigmatarchaeota archaeon]
MNILKNIITIITILILFSNVSAQTYTSTIKIIGVDKEGRGVEGNVTVEIQPGKGRILIDTNPIQGIYTQDSEKKALKVAGDITKFDFSQYDVIFSIYTPFVTSVEGPSAGAAMTIAIIAAIKNKNVSQSFSITGTIEEDHSIGQVGEIFAKTKTAAESGVSVFLIPRGQAEQIQYVRKVRTPSPGWRIETIEPVKINIIQYAKENWGVNVYEVSTIEEALKYAFGEIPTNNKKTFKEIPQLNFSFKSPLKNYEDFDYFAKSALKRAQTNYSKAKEKLNSAKLPDEINYSLTSLLRQAKELLDEGNEIYKNGYKYSAGNNGFKSSIYSLTIIDLINYYSASEANRKIVIDNKINDAMAELESTKKIVEENGINSVCNKDNFEWAVFALQRLNYAENRLSKITFDDPSTVFFDINVAKEWMKISQEMSSKMNKNFNQTCLIVFEADARKTIDDAENKINLLKTLSKDTTGAESYLEAAKLEYKKGQYIIALFDASIAKSRAQALEKFDGKQIEEIYQEFNKTDYIPTNLISTIFYEHAIFTMHNAIKTSSEYNALDAIQILYSSKETEKVYNYVNGKLNSTKEKIDLNQILIIILTVYLVTSLVYIAILKNKIKNKKHSKRKK